MAFGAFRPELAQLDQPEDGAMVKNNHAAIIGCWVPQYPLPSVEIAHRSDFAPTQPPPLGRVRNKRRLPVEDVADKGKEMSGAVDPYTGPDRFASLTQGT